MKIQKIPYTLILLSYCTILITMFSACSSQPNQPTVDLEKERSIIMELHDAQRAYHFNKDSIAFVNQLSDHFTSVNKGEITQPSREEMIKRYHGYLSSVEFIKWDDVSKPIIKFSDDGSMAYTLVDKMVSLTYETLEGETIPDSTHFAWSTIYKKYDGEWKIDCVTSTEKSKQ